MNKIFCLGEALIDMICTDAEVNLSQGVNFIKRCGGAPTNVAIALQVLGGDIQLVAAVGNDPFGQFIINTLTEFKLNTDCIFIDDEQFTTMAFVSLQKDGERDFYFKRGADSQIRIKHIQHLHLENFSIFHFGGALAFLESNFFYTYLYCLKEAKEINGFISFDPNYRHLLFKNDTEHFISHSLEFLQSADFVKLSDYEAKLISKQNNLNDALIKLNSLTKATIAITLGKEGCLLSANDTIISVPSPVVKSIDSTGAGDAFVAAMLYQIQNQKDFNNISTTTWEKFALQANNIAAKTCEYYGAIEAYYHLKKL